MKKTPALALGILLAALRLSAGEVAGVRMADTAVVEGRTLKLNGMGLRTKILFKVYVAGLYLEHPSKDAGAILAADEIRSMRLVMVRGLSGSKIADAIREGFERNSKARMASLEARLGKLRAMFPDLEKGDEVVLTSVPGPGTKVTIRGTDRGVIDGRDFADALFAVWLGPDPVQYDLKKALLGG